jgi:hypothetical protein
MDDLLGSLPFEIGCLILERVDVSSAAALTRVSRAMRSFVAASGAYLVEKHVLHGNVLIRIEADLEALRGFRVVLGSIKFLSTWGGDGLHHLFALEIVTGNVSFADCTARVCRRRV